MTRLVRLLRREPVAVVAAVEAVVVLLVTFGVLDPDQSTAVVGVVAAVAALIGGGVARQRVSPVASDEGGG